MSSRVYLLCLSTWTTCACLGWLIGDTRGMVYGLLVASTLIGFANFKD